MPSEVFTQDTTVSILWTPAMQLVVLAWLGVFGACFGSFMNVVVYRLPRGMNLSVPGSHCPKCNHAIRWYDNLPVVGWLKLKGRCRDCGVAIAARYPLVEAAVAAMFVALGWIAVLGGSLVEDEVIEPVTWAKFAVQALLLCTLLCAALIKYDGQRLPLRLFWPVICVALGVSIFLPQIYALPAAWYPGDRFAHLEGPPLGWPECLSGLVSGFLVGSVLTVLIRSTQASVVLASVCAELTALGAVLGWQATLVASLFILAAIYPAARKVRSSVGAVLLAALLWSLGIAHFTSELDLPKSTSTPTIAAAVVHDVTSLAP